MKDMMEAVTNIVRGLPAGFRFCGDGLSPTPRYKCSESALPLELLDVWLLKEDTLLLLEDRDDDDDRLRDRDALSLELALARRRGGGTGLWNQTDVVLCKSGVKHRCL